MRKGFVYLMAVSVCLALAFTPLMADRTADRTKSATRSATTGTDWSATVGDQVYHQNNGPREAADFGTQSKASEMLAQAVAVSLGVSEVFINSTSRRATRCCLRSTVRRVGSVG